MIIGGRVSSVSGTRMKETRNEGFKVSINITSAKVEKNKVTVTYAYEADYTPDVAKLNISGDIVLELSEKQAREVADKWEKEKILPDSVAIEMLSGINYTAGAVGTLLAFAIGVPAPINVPKAQVIEKEPKAA